jgi:hypothetical protein
LTVVIAHLHILSKLDVMPGRREMKARALIDGAFFGPEAMKTVCQAFDDAWRDIAGNFGNDPRDIDAARVKLAKAVLSVADEGSRDAGALKNGSLQAMALDYRAPTGGDRRLLAGG